MILVDANLLLYACDESSPRHRPAREWWEARLSEPEPVGLAWITIVAFVRIGTHPRVFEEPLSLDEACGHVDEWLGRPMVKLLTPTARHWRIFERLSKQAQAAGNLVTDAHLAALAVEHGAVLCSTDRDFARFAGLSWTDPIEETVDE
jgi:toxin-antitoxin system PIN domain toxin